MPKSLVEKLFFLITTSAMVSSCAITSGQYATCDKGTYLFSLDPNYSYDGAERFSTTAIVATAALMEAVDCYIDIDTAKDGSLSINDKTILNGSNNRPKKPAD